MKRRLLFVNLPWWEKTEKEFRRGVRAGSRWPFTVPSSYRPDCFKPGAYMPYPYFMGSAAAWAKATLSNTHEVVFRDCIARADSIPVFGKFWSDYQPTDVVVESSAPSWENDKKWIAEMKKSNIRVAVSGPVAADLMLKAGDVSVDAWILGEYEKGSVKFAEGTQGTIGFDLLTRHEMATQPFPMYDEEVFHHYWDSNPRGAPWPELTVWTSRGCPYRCQFCSWPASMTNNDLDGHGKRTIRLYEPEWIYQCIEHGKDMARRQGHKLAGVRFDGDTENISDAHTLGVCRVMERVKLPWTMMCRGDTLELDTWKAMHYAGCIGVKIGFESGSQRLVNEIIGKKLDLVETFRMARDIQRMGMTVHGTFMVGLPTETEEEKNQTLEFIQQCYDAGVISTHQLSGCAEIPNTPLAGAKKAEGFVSMSDGQKKIEKLLKHE